MIVAERSVAERRKILEEVEVYRGWLRIVQRAVRHQNGNVQRYEIVNPGSHVVAAVAFDERERVILVEQYRFGADRRLRELPAGRAEPSESLLEAMRRELLEETGYAGRLHQVGSHLIAAEHGVTKHVFVAQRCRRISPPQPDPSEIDEGMQVVPVSLEEFLRIVRSGQLTETGAAYMALDHLKLL